MFAGGVPLEAKDLRTLLKHVAGPSVELKPGVLQPMSARRVLLRLQENVRVRRLRHDDMQGALACTEDMLRIAPDNAPLWREAAVMHQRLDHVAAALQMLRPLPRPGAERRGRGPHPGGDGRVAGAAELNWLSRPIFPLSRLAGEDHRMPWDRARPLRPLRRSTNESRC